MFFFFFFNDTATTEIYTLSLHDALPILQFAEAAPASARVGARSQLIWNRSGGPKTASSSAAGSDRKSTRLNSSHANISYAVFCLKKNKKSQQVAHVHASDVN